MMESLVQGKLARRVRWGGCRNVRSEKIAARCVLTQSLRDRLGALTRKTHAEALRDASLRCARHFTALRPPLSASPSGFAVACCRGRASLLPPLSSDGSRTDRAPLVVPRLVDNSHPYHPLRGSLPNLGEFVGNDIEFDQRGPAHAVDKGQHTFTGFQAKVFDDGGGKHLCHFSGGRELDTTAARLPMNANAYL